MEKIEKLKKQLLENQEQLTQVQKEYKSFDASNNLVFTLMSIKLMIAQNIYIIAQNELLLELQQNQIK